MRWISEQAERRPQATALVDGLTGEARTFAAWERAVRRTARALEARGVGLGDRVAVLAPNGFDVLDLWFACGRLGAIFQPLNWRLAPPELRAVLDDTRPSLLIAAAALAGAVADRGPVLLDRWAAEVAAADDGPIAPRALSPQAPWVLVGTGGSTGAPKQAVLTHGGILSNAENTCATWGLGAADVTLLNAPLFHTGGLNVFTAPLALAGGVSVVLPSFEPAQVLALIPRHRVTVLFGVPTMFAALAQQPGFDAADLSSLRFAIAGGAPCPAPLFDRYRAKGVRFRVGYGLTEGAPNTFWLPDALVDARPGWVGFPVRGMEARLSDERDGVGALELKGPCCAGYWERPDATRALFTADGWLKTGDLAARGPDGAYRIAGRAKELIISGGENVYPAEVESVLAAHPAVREVAVLGEPDARWGEAVVAHVVLGADVDDAALRAFAKERLAGYKVPKRFVRHPALPRTGAGKVDRRALTSGPEPR